MLGINKEAWQAVHTNLAVLFTVAAVWHLLLNWSMLVGYVRQWGLKGLLFGPVGAAVVVAAVFVVATLQQWIPWRWIQQGNDQIKAHWEERLPRPPSPHAEEWTVAELAQRLAVSPEQIIQALQAEGFGQPTAEDSLAQIAVGAGQAPYQVFEAIRRRFPQAEQALQPGMGKGRQQGKKGQGKKSVRLAVSTGEHFRRIKQLASPRLSRRRRSEARRRTPCIVLPAEAAVQNLSSLHKEESRKE